MALTPEAAAAVLGLSDETLLKLTMAEAIPHAVLAGETVYPVEALEAWLERHTVWPREGIDAPEPTDGE
jgi:hypothetical protein